MCSRHSPPVPARAPTQSGASTESTLALSRDGHWSQHELGDRSLPTTQQDLDHLLAHLISPLSNSGFPRARSNCSNEPGKLAGLECPTRSWLQAPSSPVDNWGTSVSQTRNDHHTAKAVWKSSLTEKQPSGSALLRGSPEHRP